MKETKTYCFYQEGAAEVELDFWESMQKQFLKTEVEFKGKKLRIYALDKTPRKQEIEHMICIPDTIGINAELHNFLNNIRPAEYKKTLYFGKITSEYAQILSNFIKACKK